MPYFVSTFFSGVVLTHSNIVSAFKSVLNFLFVALSGKTDLDNEALWVTFECDRLFEELCLFLSVSCWFLAVPRQRRAWLGGPFVDTGPRVVIHDKLSRNRFIVQAFFCTHFTLFMFQEFLENWVFAFLELSFLKIWGFWAKKFLKLSFLSNFWWKYS